MTALELIAVLSKLDPSAEVLVVPVGSCVGHPIERTKVHSWYEASESDVKRAVYLYAKESIK